MPKKVWYHLNQGSGGESVEVADDKGYISDFAQIDELQATVQELTKMVQSMKQKDHGKELAQLLRLMQ